MFPSSSRRSNKVKKIINELANSCRVLKRNSTGQKPNHNDKKGRKKARPSSTCGFAHNIWHWLCGQKESKKKENSDKTSSSFFL
jgi:hypothetical protein